jgi:formyl-CoA transferase
MRFSRTQTQRVGAGPVLGSDTREALREVGYSDEEVDALVRAGTAREAQEG